MTTSREFIDYLAGQIALGDRLTHRRLFGEYALYIDDKVVAFACDNSLFIKPSQASMRLAPDLPQRPPYPGSRDYPVADELLDDSDRMCKLILATAALMPARKRRKTGTGTRSRSRGRT